MMEILLLMTDAALVVCLRRDGLALPLASPVWLSAVTLSLSVARLVMMVTTRLATGALLLVLLKRTGFVLLSAPRASENAETEKLSELRNATMEIFPTLMDVAASVFWSLDGSVLLLVLLVAPYVVMDTGEASRAATMATPNLEMDVPRLAKLRRATNALSMDHLVRAFVAMALKSALRLATTEMTFPVTVA